MVRYNGFVCEAYTVLRFGWKHAMLRRTTSGPRSQRSSLRKNDQLVASRTVLQRETTQPRSN